MTTPSPTPRRTVSGAPAIVAALAGVVVLAFVGAPQSVDVLLLIGLDQPQVIGSQLVVGLAGAAGICVAVALVRHWALVTVFGSVLVTLSYVVHHSVRPGMTVRVVGPGDNTAPADVVNNADWEALLVGGAAVVLIGVLGAAGHLVHAGRRGAGFAVAGLATTAGFLGSLLLGGLAGGQSPAVRLTVLAVATVVAGAAVGFGKLTTPGRALSRRAMVLACVAAALPVVPTVTVALTGAPTYERTGSAVACWLVLVAAVVTAGLAGRVRLLGALGAGLALAAPVPMIALVLVGSTSEGSPALWVAAVPAALVVAALVVSRTRLTTAVMLVVVLVETALFVYFAALPGGLGRVDAWIVYALAAIAVAGAVAVGAGVASGLADAVDLPLLAPCATAIAVGLRVVLDTVQLKPGSDTLTTLFGPGAQWISAVMLLAGGVLLVVMTRPAPPAGLTD